MINRPSKLKACHGLTMVEVFVVTVIFAFILGFVVYITFFVGKNSNIVNAESKAEMLTRNASELIRKQLTMASTTKGNVISIGNPNTSITWKKYSTDTTNSFSFTNGVLTFDSDTAAAGVTRQIGGSSNLASLTDVRFTNPNNNKGIIDVTVVATANALGGDKVITVSQQFTIRPRN